MKFVRFVFDNKPCEGILFDDKIKKIDSTTGKLNVNLEYSIDQVEILPPSNPSKIVCIGENYLDHIEEMGSKKVDEPIIFMKPSSSVISHQSTIIIPHESERVDYEAELGVIIGAVCKNVSKENAKDYILGYTCLNDVTARDIQQRESQWIRAKGYDTFCPIGPCLETDLDPTNLDIKLYVNGELKQSSNTKNMMRDVYSLTSYISKIMTLYPGDIIATGTPKGVGRLMDSDVVTVEIEKIGRLTNYVSKEQVTL